MRNETLLVLLPQTPLSPLLLVISGSAMLDFLAFLYSISHFQANNSQTNRPTCVSKWTMFKTIEEEKWGMRVHSRWKPERVNTGMIEVSPPPYTHFQIKPSYWTALGGSLERLRLSFIWNTPRLRGRGNFLTVQTYSNSLLYAHKFEVFQQQV